MFIDLEIQCDGFTVNVALQILPDNGIVDPVMNVELDRVLRADPVSADIRFVCDDECRRNRIKCRSGGFIVICDAGDDLDTVCKRKIGLLKNFICEQCAILSVMTAVDGIANIMKISGNFDEFDLMVGIAELIEYICCLSCNNLGVANRMIRIAELA